MRKIFLIIVLVLTTTLIHAQKFTLGPVIGFNSSKLTTDIPEMTEEAKQNFLFGAFARIGNKIYLQPEFVYATKGGELKLNNVADAEMTINMKQLEVPVLIGWRMIDLKVVNLRLMGGPVAGFVVGKEVNASEVVQDPIPESSLKDIAWSAHLGAGIDILFMSLDVRYEIGLNNLYEAASGGPSYELKNNLWRISLGFKLL